MKKIKVSFIFVIGICLLTFIIFTSIEEVGSSEFIWFEAENADNINQMLSFLPLYGDVDASGGKAIKSVSPSHKLAGYAAYTFNIQCEDEYILWMRAFWTGGCNNSYQVVIDKNNFDNFGNDNLFNIWHWVKGKSYFLSKGKHILYVWNDEYDARIDKILITASPVFIPLGTGEMSNIKINFEDKKYNINNYITASSRSYDIAFDSVTYNHQLYIHPSKGASNVFMFKKQQKDFVVKVKYKGNIEKKYTDFFLKFNYVDGNNNYCLRVNKNNIEVILNETGKSKSLGRYKDDRASLINPECKELTLIRVFPKIKIEIDGNELFPITDHTFELGNIIMGSEKGDIFLDDIEYINDLRPALSENFYWDYKGNEYIKSLAGQWSYNVGQGWMVGNTTGKYPAIAGGGENYWFNYSMTCAIKNEAGKYSDGICFYYQNNTNFYLLRYVYPKTGKTTGNLQFIKTYHGDRIICKESKLNLTDQWNRFDIQAINGRFFIFVNKKKMFELFDTSITEGKFGFWTDSPYPVFFDDLYITSTPGPIIPFSNSLNYTFEMRQKSSVDMADWKITPKDAFHIITGNAFYCFFEKEIFQNLYLENIHPVKGNFNCRIDIGKPIPKDIGMTIKLLNIRNKKKDVMYEFKIQDDSIHLVRNHKKIKSQGYNQLIHSIVIIYKNKKWTWEMNDGPVLTYSDTTTFQETKLGLVLDGIGKSEIIFNTINIQADSILFNK
jgi:hypothetical protein